MNVELRPVPPEERATLENLLEKYNYEFSQYDRAPFDETGLYHYRYLDLYWTEDSRFPYFIRVDGALAGFALINAWPECDRPLDHAVAEFFVSYNYRRGGVGTEVMRQLFQRHKGRWQLKYHPKNTASAAFWNRIAAAWDPGYETLRGAEDYEDGTPSVALCMEIK